ncbi:hypothetical protein THTE_1727 [Thermogutta terrifontis]|uniref:Uncharacterized protein n=1 Tax=Thermogutta terrifontis TaxID=1331910 RepID=A0A286RED2_9BACT|nr:hypothetical protein THTE_1727 [Thermogutta terrifontis]
MPNHLHVRGNYEMPRRKVSQGQFMNGPSQGTVFVVAANTGSAK